LRAQRCAGSSRQEEPPAAAAATLTDFELEIAMKVNAALSCAKRATRRFLWLGMFLMAGTASAATTVTVGTAAELASAVANANATGGDMTILLRDGTYTLSDTLYVNAPNVTIASQSGVREKVIVQGDAMSATARIGNVIRVAASGFGLDGVTLQRSGWHAIQIAGEMNADAPVIRNCILRDTYEQLLKVTLDPANPAVTSDNGIVENCIFDYSAGIGPQYYIGGIDAHGSKGWLVRGNTFRNIISPSGSVAEFAIHFWDATTNTTVERNLIVNCDRGIGFGMDGRGNTGGIIRNNMIYHAANAGQFADVAISLMESPGSQVYNNTVVMDNSFPWAIEYRFATTTNVLIANNLSNRPVMQRDGATGSVTRNVTNASGTWFVNRAAGDLHLVAPVSGVSGAGQTLSGLTDDYDGQARPATAIDTGADQFGTSSKLPAPTNLRITG
jgi:hypothetical protein